MSLEQFLRVSTHWLGEMLREVLWVKKCATTRMAVHRSLFFFFFYKNFTYAEQLFTVPFPRFRFQRLQVATILHCLNYFLPTRGCNSHVCERCKFVKGLTKFTSGAHDVIAITSPQKNDLCTEELQDRAQVMKLLSHWTRSVYRLEELDSIVYFLGRERGLWS